MGTGKGSQQEAGVGSSGSFHDPGPQALRRRWSLYALMAGLIVVAAALRLPGLDDTGLWFDEWITLEQATRPELGDAFTASATHPPLLRLLVRGSVALLGDPRVPGGMDVAARLPAALLGVAGVVLIFFYARRFSGGRQAVGLVAAALYALSPYGIYYAQEARYYAGMVFFSAWALLALARLVDSPRNPWCQVSLTLALFMGIYNHHLFGILFLLTFGSLVPWILHRPRIRWPAVLPWILSGLAFLPWFFHVVTHLEPQARPWIPWLGMQLEDTGVAFFTGRIGAYHLSPNALPAHGGSAVLSGAGWSLLAMGLAVHAWRRRSAPLPRFRYGLVTLFIVGTGLGAAAIGHHHSDAARFFHHKYLAFLVPPLCLGLAELGVYLVGGLRAPVLRTRRAPAALALWSAALAATLVSGALLARPVAEAFGRFRPGSAAPFRKERYREAARLVEARRRPGDVAVILDPHARYNNVELLSYYGLSEPWAVFRHHHLQAPGSFWAAHPVTLPSARALWVITTHCSDQERAVVEETAAWGFPRRDARFRLRAPEGTIQITRLLPSRGKR